MNLKIKNKSLRKILWIWLIILFGLAGVIGILKYWLFFSSPSSDSSFQKYWEYKQSLS